MDARLARRVLEVSGEADAAELRQAYRDLIRVWHPDRFGSDARLRARGERRTAELNLAFRFLADSCGVAVNGNFSRNQGPTAESGRGTPPSTPHRVQRRPAARATSPAIHRAAVLVVALVAAAVLLVGSMSQAAHVETSAAVPVPAAPGLAAVGTSSAASPSSIELASSTRRVLPTSSPLPKVSPFSRDVDRVLAHARGATQSPGAAAAMP